MNKQQNLTKIAFGVALFLSTTQTFAAGFQLNAQSATGLGRAFAGDAVIADNASVMAKNPAAMALFKDDAFSVGFESISTKIKVSDGQYKGILSPVKAIPDDSIGGTSVAPNIYYIHRLDDRFAVGASIYSNFGTKTEFSNNYAANEYGGLTKIESINLGLAGSYRLNEQWSFGAGIDFIFGRGTFNRSLGSTALINVEDAKGRAVGFNLGTVYELDKNTRFGLDYHYSPDITVKDDYGQKIKLPLPDMAEFSGYHKVPDSRFAIHYSVQWIGWSKFKNIKFSELSAAQSPILGSVTSNYQKDYDWKDAFHFSLGTTYELNQEWTLRTGVMLDTTAQDKIKSISVPDSTRRWLSAGATYHINKHSSVDFGATYLMGEKVEVTEALQIGPLGSSISASTKADAILLGLQYSYNF